MSVYTHINSICACVYVHIYIYTHRHTYSAGKRSALPSCRLVDEELVGSQEGHDLTPALARHLEIR